MNLVRKYKLYKFFGEPLNVKELEIILFIKETLKDLVQYKDESYPDTIFYMKGDKLVLEENLKSEYLRVRYECFWHVLERIYLMRYIDVQVIMKYMIEEVFKRKVVTPDYVMYDVSQLIEKAFIKNKNLT